MKKETLKKANELMDEINCINESLKPIKCFEDSNDRSDMNLSTIFGNIKVDNDMRKETLCIIKKGLCLKLEKVEEALKNLK